MPSHEIIYAITRGDVYDLLTEYRENLPNSPIARLDPTKLNWKRIEKDYTNAMAPHWQEVLADILFTLAAAGAAERDIS